MQILVIGLVVLDTVLLAVLVVFVSGEAMSTGAVSVITVGLLMLVGVLFAALVGMVVGLLLTKR